MAVKLLVGVSSCNKFEDNGFNDALRESCLKDLKGLGVDYKIFHGSKFHVLQEETRSKPLYQKVTTALECTSVKDDVVLAPVDDSYYGILEKYVEKCKYMVNNGYDYMFNCYYDTYIVGSRLLTSGFERYDYSGRYGAPYYMMHCQGGPGVFVSRRLCSIVAEDMLNATKGHSVGTFCDIEGGYLEDFWTGILFNDHKDTLTTCDFSARMIDLHKMEEVGPKKNNDIMSMHMSTLRSTGTEYEGKHMTQKHKEWVDSWL